MRFSGINITGGTIISGSNVVINGRVVQGGSGETVEGNGEVAQEKREVGESFDRVQISNGIKANIQMGDKEEVSLSADSNILSKVETKVRDGKLIISPKDNVNLNPKNPIEATLFMTDLSGITASTSAAVTATGVEASRLRLDASTSANISVSGQADVLMAEGSTSGSIDASQLASDTVLADASTSSTLRVNSHDEVNADASTGASVYYFGDPKVVNKDTSTGGSVRPG